MAIIKNNKKYVSVYHGTTRMTKIYKGSQCVFNDLPKGFVRCEYLESTSTQYIDTNWQPQIPLSIKLDVQATATGTSKLLGSQNSVPNYFDIDYYGTTGNANLRCNDTNSFANSSDRRKYNIEITSTTKKMYIDGVLTIDNTSTYSLSNSMPNLYLLAGNQAGAVSLPTPAKLYSCQIYDNSVLVRNFIPCLDTTGTPCLYDTVSKTCFYNQGTGQFKYKVKVPSGYQTVEYIGSTGKQYIDTLFTPNQDTKVIATFSGTSGQTNIFFGAGQSYNRLSYECYLQGSDYNSNYANQNTKVAGSYTTGNLVSVDKNKNNTTFVSNGNTYNVNSTYDTFTAPYTMNIFRLNRPSPYQSGTDVKLYDNLQVYDDGTLVRFFQPCYRISDNEIGLYDLVNRKFYTNAGTGTFTKGSDI